MWTVVVMTTTGSNKWDAVKSQTSTTNPINPWYRWMKGDSSGIRTLWFGSVSSDQGFYCTHLVAFACWWSPQMSVSSREVSKKHKSPWWPPGPSWKKTEKKKYRANDFMGQKESVKKERNKTKRETIEFAYWMCVLARWHDHRENSLLALETLSFLILRIWASCFNYTNDLLNSYKPGPCVTSGDNSHTRLKTLLRGLNSSDQS